VYVNLGQVVIGSANFSPRVLAIYAGSINFMSAVTSTGNVIAQGGTLQYSAGATLNSLNIGIGVFLEISGGTITTVTNSFTWSGGNINRANTGTLTLAVNSVASVFNGFNDPSMGLYQGAITSSAAITFGTDYGFTLFNSSVFTNGATFTVAGEATDAYIRSGGGNATFANKGTISIPTAKILHMCVKLQEYQPQTYEGCLDTTCDGTMCGASNQASSPMNHAALIGGLVGGGIVLLIAVGVIIFFVRRRAQATKAERAHLLGGAKA